MRNATWLFKSSLGAVVGLLGLLCLPAPAHAVGGGYNDDIQVAPLEVRVEEGGDVLVGSCIARNQPFYVACPEIYDLDPVDDPDPENDEVTVTWEYRHNGGAWEDLSGETLDPVSYGVYESVVQPCFTADGTYEIRLTVDDGGAPQNDDPVPVSTTIEVLGVDYLVIEPNPGEVALGDTITFTGHAYNNGPNGVPGGGDDVEKHGTFEWELDGPGDLIGDLSLGPGQGGTGVGFTGTAVGTGAITGWFWTIPATTTVVVNDVTVTVSPSPAYVAVGGAKGFTAEAKDSEGNSVSGTFNWTASVGSVNPGTGDSTTLTAQATPGQGTVTATHEKSGKSGQAMVYVLKVEITEPDEEPATDNNFTFDTANPGVCDIVATGTCGVESEDPNLEWTMPAIPGCTLTSNPTPPKGSSVTFTHTTLPLAGSLGEKKLTFKHPQLPDSCKVEQAVQVFFDGGDNAANHPGAGAGSTPNWFYYWLGTSAAHGTPEYDAGVTRGETKWVNNAWVAFIGPGGNDSYTPPPGGNQLDGIDAFAWACRHEDRHVQTLTAWYPTGYVAGFDMDNDLIPDTQEAALGGTWENPLNGGPFVPTQRDTDGDNMRDGEDYTVATQDEWTGGAADDEDWADPGHQSDQ